MAGSWLDRLLRRVKKPKEVKEVTAAIKEEAKPEPVEVAERKEVTVTTEKPTLGELELHPNPGRFIAEVLKEEGVKYVFGVWGGHEWAWIDEIMRLGMFHITFGHEEQAGYAAEAYARMTGKPGVCNVTVGPGVSNITSAVQQAYGSNTPIVILCAGHEAFHDRMYALQECRAPELFRTICKWTQRVIDPNSYKYMVRKALRECQEPPKGPIALEFEACAQVGLLRPLQPHDELYLANWLKEPVTRRRAPADAIEKAVKNIYSTDKVCMLAGDGVLWSQASPELREFVELAQVPVLGRRGARGSVPENHPLHYKPASIIGEADLFILLGARLDFYDWWGQLWGVKRTIQINDCFEFIHPWFPTDLAINADPKLVLQDMLDYIKTNKLTPPPGRAEWVKHVQEVESSRKARLAARAEKYKDMRKPLHGGYVCKVLWDTIEALFGGKCIMIWDSFTGSNVMGPFVQARFAGQCIDSGIQAGVGHGCGQAIGAAFALREKGQRIPIFAMMGDAGMHHAMDIETAIRHQLPIVYGVWNNDGWMPGCRNMWYGPNWEMIGWPKLQYLGLTYPPHEFLPKIRYDKMWEAVGAHGEYVDEPEQIRPALERAFAAAERGQPAVVNFIVNQDVPVQSVLLHPVANALQWWIPWDELPRRGKFARVNAGLVPPELLQKYGLPSAAELAFDLWEPPTAKDWEPYAPQKQPRPVPPWYVEKMRELGSPID